MQQLAPWQPEDRPAPRPGNRQGAEKPRADDETWWLGLTATAWILTFTWGLAPFLLATFFFPWGLSAFIPALSLVLLLAGRAWRRRTPPRHS